jgi:DNA-binding MarR family transcriptional regulator
VTGARDEELGVADDARARALEAVRALARASSVLERSNRDLSLAHYRILAAVASGHERASNVAANLALGKPAVSAAVDALVQRGLLARFEVDADHRAATLRLTPRGEQVLDETETEMLDRLGDLARRTPDGDALLESLVWLGRAVDERRAERRQAAAGACR